MQTDWNKELALLNSKPQNAEGGTVTLRRHARYALPDGTRVKARCWEFGTAAPVEWRLHADDELGTALYCVEGDRLLRYAREGSGEVLAPTDLTLDDLTPLASEG